MNDIAGEDEKKMMINLPYRHPHRHSASLPVLLIWEVESENGEAGKAASVFSQKSEQWHGHQFNSLSFLSNHQCKHTKPLRRGKNESELS